MKVEANCEQVSLSDGLSDVLRAIDGRMQRAGKRYGPFASTHEALGVAVEEWDELRDAIRENEIDAVEHECIDLCAVLLRLVISLRTSDITRNRSIK